MRVQLISPFLEDKTGYPQIYRFPNTGLALLAALTPPDIDVSIIDEIYDTVDFDRTVDLVGIAVTSKTVARAYQLADQFRRGGVAVVLGGIHPTILPDEAIQHADAVVMGEAEDVWGKVLEDFKNGRLIDDNWWLKYKSEDVVYIPKQMTREELYEGWVSMMKEYYTIPSTLKRCSTGINRRSLFANVLNYKVNMGYRRNAYAMPEQPAEREISFGYHLIDHSY